MGRQFAAAERWSRTLKFPVSAADRHFATVTDAIGTTTTTLTDAADFHATLDVATNENAPLLNREHFLAIAGESPITVSWTSRDESTTIGETFSGCMFQEVKVFTSTLTGKMNVPMGTIVGTLSSKGRGLFDATGGTPSTPMVGTSSLTDTITVMTPGCDATSSETTGDEMDNVYFDDQVSGVWDADSPTPKITATSMKQGQIRTTPVTVTTQWNLIPKD